MRGLALIVIASAASVALVGAAARPAHATYPGLNGPIAFAGNETGNFDIYRVNPEGSGLTDLTANDPTSDLDPAWSPDGTTIAFTTRRDGNREIYVMNA